MASIAEQSYDVCNYATQKAGDTGANWNTAFIEAVREKGFELISVTWSTHLGEDGPLMAPAPFEEGYQYPYPCVVAPKGWRPQHEGSE